MYLTRPSKRREEKEEGKWLYVYKILVSYEIAQKILKKELRLFEDNR